MKTIPIAIQNKAALDVLSKRKFIIMALSSGRFDNTQSLTARIIADGTLITLRKYSQNKHIVFKECFN
jgi:hypothetical protein